MDHLPGRLKNGGLYSWFETEEEITEACKYILAHIVEHGPYEAVYGFSQGGFLVTLLSSKKFRAELGNSEMVPWNFCILACAAVSSKRIELPVDQDLPSFHLVGMTDPFKPQSDVIVQRFDAATSLVLYLESGHEVPQGSNVSFEIMQWYQQHTDAPQEAMLDPMAASTLSVGLVSITNDINNFLKDQDAPRSRRMPQRLPAVGLPRTSSQLQVQADVQLALNSYQSVCSRQETLWDMLEQANPEDVALYAPGAPALTYAQLLDFISTNGDLRVLGLKQDSVVAYLAPNNLAVAFLTIASQCTAAPLDPTLSRADLDLALEQIKPDMVIFFQGVNAEPGLAAAAAAGIEAVRAETIPETCGLFRFLTQLRSTSNGEKLVTPPESNGLLLRTSGTPSKPKLVPLKMSSIVANAKAIAKDLGLRSSDIALNAMPLFHIGGLSANLLSSMAAGASVILLPRFDVSDFIDHIFATEVRPTWYIAVSTCMLRFSS